MFLPCTLLLTLHGPGFFLESTGTGFCLFAFYFSSFFFLMGGASHIWLCSGAVRTARGLGVQSRLVLTPHFEPFSYLSSVMQEDT